MVDNVAITAGAGTTVATDEIGGAHYQRVKVTHGADGSATDASAANPLPVIIANLTKAEDAAHSSGDIGVQMLGVRQDAAGALSGTSGDYNPLQLDARGELRTIAGGYKRNFRGGKGRPGDTTQYTAGDVISEPTTPTVWTFGNMARYAGGSGAIRRVFVQDSANQAVKPQLALWLFSVAPAATADNAPFAPSDTELDALVGIIRMPYVSVGNTTAGAGGNCVLDSGEVFLPYGCDAASTSLFGVLVVENAYTPVNGEGFALTVRAELD